MANTEHLETLKDVASWNEWRKSNPKIVPDLEAAHLPGAILSGANLAKVNLKRAHLVQAILDGAILTDSHCEGAKLMEADLTGADLTNADLTRANLQSAILVDANLAHATCYETSFRESNLAGLKGAHRAKFLETAQVPSEDVKYFSSCVREWPEKWVDWERIRTVGRLPLFGISYSVLILIPFFFFGLAVYNDNVELVQTWASQLDLTSEGYLKTTTELIMEHLQPLPIPSLSLLLLMSAVSLAIASTLYTLFCPSRIKEFSQDVWQLELRLSLIHYWPFAWKGRWIRLFCATCYILGGFGALYVLVLKLWSVALFILENSYL